MINQRIELMKIKPIKGIIKNQVFSVKISNHSLGLPLQEDDNYTVFTDGTVYSEKRRKYLKPGTNKGGYKYFGICTNGKSKSQLAHRLVANTFIPNFNDSPQIDHIDHNRQNNNVNNLRWVTNQKNQFNTSSVKGSSSQYVGVSWAKDRDKWKAQIETNGKNENLGYFKTEIEAHEAYQTAKAQLHKI
ncbi:HNH endonuclease [Hymenobacter aerilatus]|uniref:HNH endonuclease n=1 Tax=Hymenobacter aerilatus TaxID=2932251 RepID=A0A8T9SVC4_9BACT|nr:HNH endonuclease [Hymenobacter aerilatus]UOR05845.1 HNH endonuclease [Hymenobacter aerilatus]